MAWAWPSERGWENNAASRLPQQAVRAPEPPPRAVGGTVLPGETPPTAGLWQAGKREVGLSQRPPAWPESLVTLHRRMDTLRCTKERLVGFAEALDTSGERNRGVRDVVVVFGLS